MHKTVCALLVVLGFGCVYGFIFAREHTDEYITALAREVRLEPLFAISGTDPDKLRRAISNLETATSKLSELQKTNTEMRYVQESLYPIQFLYSLANLEETRLALIASPSNANAIAYERSLMYTIREGARANMRFARAIRGLTRLSLSKTPDLYSLAGLITKDSFEKAALANRERFRTATYIAYRRWICRITQLCFQNDTSPFLSKDLPPPPQDSADPLYIKRVEDFFLLTKIVATSTPEKISIILSQSACIRELPAPYHYLLFAEKKVRSRDTVHFTNDIFFTPTEKRPGAILALLAEQGINHAIVRPLLFYQCPESQYDLGMLSAIKNTLAIAKKSPGVAPVTRARLFNAPSDTMAFKYVHAALQEKDLTPDKKLVYEEILLQLEARNTRFDVLIQEIATVIDTRASQVARDVPFELNALNMFLTHSAFSSLFLTHDTSVIKEVATLTERAPQYLAEYEATHARFSELQFTVGVDALVRASTALRKFDTPSEHL
ncbi:MAG: hypothetical protein AAB421_05765 [Patescibacteria group bacterium]